ncbi:hypothetical protein HY229_08670 [Candidatus Acetothermia bacterium]|nr:hypothetical protein [Candidatus Acetothermia bacterium]MBI3644154.1 hypothetical protein [Candidatus Acetothermia bacterium]
MNRRNIFILSLLLVLSVIFVTSCGKSPSTSTQPGNQNSSSSSSNPTGSTPPNTTSPASTPTSPAADATKVSLKLNVQTGQSYRSKMTTSQTTTVVMDGQTQNSDSTMDAVMKFDVSGVDAVGLMTVVSKYESVNTQSHSGTQASAYDSTNPSASQDPEAKMWDAVMAAPITMVLSRQGQVQEVQGVSDVLDHVLKQYDDAKRKLIEPTLRSTFSDQYFKDQMSDYFAPLPDHLVAVGDSWQSTTTVSSGVPLVMENTMTLKKREAGVATISIQTTLNTNPHAAPLKIGPVETSYQDLSGTQSAELQIDEKTGWIVKETVTQDFKGHMSMKIDQLGFQQTAIPITGHTDMTYELIRPQ